MMKCRFVRGMHGVALVLLVAGFALLGGCRAETPSATKPTITPAEHRNLQQVLDEVLDHTYEQRHLNLRDHAAWQILHGVLAFKRDFMVVGTDGELIGAVDHLLGGGQMKGFIVEPVIDEASGHRGIRAILEKGSKTGQGHYDQWLAILAQTELPPDEPIRVQGHDMTMADFVRQVQWDMPRNVDREYSWTIIGLTTYLPTDARWTAQDGKEWSIEQLVEVEAQYELGEGACGGTHRLGGLAITLNRHLARGGKIEGAWESADDRIQDAIAKARTLQNADGSFSTSYFARGAHSPDLSARLATTGHILEFLTLAMTDEQLREPWVEAAVLHVCEILQKAKNVPLECGALYHAARGLRLYRERLYGPREFLPSNVSKTGVPPSPST